MSRNYLLTHCTRFAMLCSVSFHFSFLLNSWRWERVQLVPRMSCKAAVSSSGFAEYYFHLTFLQSQDEHQIRSFQRKAEVNHEIQQLKSKMRDSQVFFLSYAPFLCQFDMCLKYRLVNTLVTSEEPTSYCMYDSSFWTSWWAVVTSQGGLWREIWINWLHYKYLEISFAWMLWTLKQLHNLDELDHIFILLFRLGNLLYCSCSWFVPWLCSLNDISLLPMNNMAWIICLGKSGFRHSLKELKNMIPL